jgi:hypothetical protein
MSDSPSLFTFRYKVASLRFRLAQKIAPKGVTIWPPMTASQMIGRKRRRG